MKAHSYCPFCKIVLNREEEKFYSYLLHKHDSFIERWCMTKECHNYYAVSSSSNPPELEYLAFSININDVIWDIGIDFNKNITSLSFDELMTPSIEVNSVPEIDFSDLTNLISQIKLYLTFS